MHESDLNSLLARVATGDSDAFAQFYDATCDRVYGMTLRVLRDPGYSEEATQETYLAVWRNADSYDPRSGSALSWILTLAHRRAVDRVRSESAATRRAVAYGIADTGREIDEVSESVERREIARLIHTGLENLTPLQRQAIELAYFHGLTYREVSEHLGVALPTVKSRIRDGLIRLRQTVPGLAAVG
ncbi:ECF RNA polymerase sigma factor SigK [Gordonia sp. YY1]|uniref:ECF RNA polymerase sigma factor SigK n=1 Tax=Gordonia sp. YY1 TaxID=396712 RepID=UPI001331976F|nr:ECF RNA polymerase sigma factor SigK [Gordonia sp. YY1]KAF0969423.1 ECF RNA polymerase sigma factor SigK [Gordonia sp. YY1]UOG23192.1 ECF RNA polymerase sigma factor SigK [Gordonia amicalis]